MKNCRKEIISLFIVMVPQSMDNIFILSNFLGLTEMLSGSATQVLSTFQQILYDLELTTQSDSSHVILSKIKNMMSDRHIVEKNFNSLLQSYRMEVLPSVVDNWAELGKDEQQGISTLNNFFCGLHLLEMFHHLPYCSGN